MTKIDPRVDRYNDEYQVQGIQEPTTKLSINSFNAELSDDYHRSATW